MKNPNSPDPRDWHIDEELVWLWCWEYRGVLYWRLTTPHQEFPVDASACVQPSFPPVEIYVPIAEYQRVKRIDELRRKHTEEMRHDKG